LLLLLPELALPGFFSAGALLTCPAAAAHQAVAVAVLSGGDGAHYVPGRELVHAGFSSRLVLIGPRVTARKDALATLRFVAIWDKVTPANSWGEAQTTPLSVRFVESEALKLGYHLLHYRFGLWR